MTTIVDLKLNIDNCIHYIKDKYGEQENLTPAEWLSLITEEVGEFAKEINDNSLQSNFAEEGCQICATVLCAMEQILNKKLEGSNMQDKKFIIKKNDRTFVVYAKDQAAANDRINNL